MCIYLTVFTSGCCLGKLIDGPKSASAMIGEISSFNCSGFEIVIWLVNGVHIDHVSVSERGIGQSVSTTTTNGSTLAQISVPATAENNNISISCAVFDGSSVDTSSEAVLTVLGKMHLYFV